MYSTNAAKVPETQIDKIVEGQIKIRSKYFYYI